MNKGPEELLIAFLSTKKASQKNVPKKNRRKGDGMREMILS